MSITIDGSDPTNIFVDPNSSEIVIMSSAGPAGPQGEAGPAGAAFEGDTIMVTNVEGDLLKVDVAAQSTPLVVSVSNLDEIVIPAPELNLPSTLNVNVQNASLSVDIEGELKIDDSTPINVAISGGVSTFDGQLVQLGNAVSTTNRLPVAIEFPTTQNVAFSATPTVNANVTFPATQQVSLAAASSIRMLQSDGTSITSTNPLFTNALLRHNNSSGVNTQTGEASPLPIRVFLTGSNAVTSSNRLPVDVTFPTTQNVAFSATPTVNIGTAPAITVTSITNPVAITAAAPLDVNIVSGGSGGGSSFDGQLVLNGDDVSAANPLPIYAADYLETSIRWQGPAKMPVADVYGLFVQPDANAIFPVTVTGGTGAIDVNIVSGGGSGGGETFDGQLTMGGNAVSTANRLPVDVTFPTTQTISGSVSLTGTGQTKLVLDGSNSLVGDSNPMPTTSELRLDSLPLTTTNRLPVRSDLMVAGAMVSDANPIPVAVVSATSSVVLTDRSGSITSGGVAQTLMASNSSRRGLWVQNLSSGDLYVCFVGTATAGGSSIKLAAGALYESPAHGVPVSHVSIFGATTGQAFSANEW